MLVIFSIVLITFLLSIFISNEKTSNTFLDFSIITFTVTFALFVMDISLAIGMNDKSEEIISQYIEENENHLLEYGLYEKEQHKLFDYLFYNEEFIYIKTNSKELNNNALILKELNDFKDFVKEESIRNKLLIYLDDRNVFVNIYRIDFENMNKYELTDDKHIRIIN